MAEKQLDPPLAESAGALGVDVVVTVNDEDSVVMLSAAILVFISVAKAIVKLEEAMSDPGWVSCPVMDITIVTVDSR